MKGSVALTVTFFGKRALFAQPDILVNTLFFIGLLGYWIAFHIGHKNARVICDYHETRQRILAS